MKYFGNQTFGQIYVAAIYLMMLTLFYFNDNCVCNYVFCMIFNSGINKIRKILTFPDILIMIIIEIKRIFIFNHRNNTNSVKKVKRNTRVIFTVCVIF